MELEQALSNAIAQAEHYARVVKGAKNEWAALENEQDKHRSQATEAITALGIPSLETQLTVAANDMMAAMRRKLELQAKHRPDLAGEDAVSIEAEVTAEVEAEFATTAEERKAAKLPNNEAVRRAEVLRRLMKHQDYRYAMTRRDDARNELAQVDLQFNIAEINHKATRVVLDSRVAQLKALTGI